MLKLVLPAMAGVAAVLAFAAPSVAQTGTLVIFGNDKCPANAICVRAPESERYRIPQGLRSSPLAPSEQPWSARAESVANAGAAGQGSCSATGSAGQAGCWGQMMRDARAANQQDAAAAADSPLPR